MRYIRFIGLAGVLGFLLCTQSGCLLLFAAAGTGATVAYVRGDSEAVVDASPKQVAEATVAAAKQMDLILVSNQSSSLDAKVLLRTAQDKKLTVEATAEGGHASRVSVREEVFGDDAIQNALLAKIRENLKPASTVTSARE